MNYRTHNRISHSILVLTLSVLVCVTLLVSRVTEASPTYTMNYQGKLTNASNVAVENGTYNMRFWITTSPTIATTSALWTESLTGTNKVQVTNGLFSIMLGSTTPLTGVDWNQPLYLGVEVGGTTTPLWDGEMSPRKILGTVPSAFEAQNARTIDSLATTSLLRSDVDDTASGLLTFTGGFISNSSSTITNLTTLVATTTTLVINGESFRNLTGSGMSNVANTLTCATGGSATFGCLLATDWNIFNNKISSTSIDTSAELAALLSDETGTAGFAVFSQNPLLSGFRSNASSTIGDGTGAGGLTISGNGTTTGNMYVAGMLGVGTIPSYPLHILGQCVTADTRLRRRRRRKEGEIADEEKGEWADLDYIYDKPMIKDIRSGDEVQSLDMKTGSLVWSTVNGVLYTGIQPIVRLTTQSGRTIRTTATHPYFMRVRYEEAREKTTQKLYRFEVDQSVRFDEYGRDTFISVANTENVSTVRISREDKALVRDTLKTKFPKQMAPTVFALGIVSAMRALTTCVHELVIDTEYGSHEDTISAIIKQVFPSVMIYFAQVGKKSPAHKGAYGAFIGKRECIDTTITPVDTENALQAVLYGHIHSAHLSLQALPVPHSIEKEGDSVNITPSGAWVQASLLKEGQMIAVVHGDIVVWERITHVDLHEKESVYDIEIDGTHNFIGNDIVAHNTYLGGGLRVTASSTIGDGTGAGGLTIYGNATTTRNAYFGGNVGIGSTTPSSLLTVAGDAYFLGNMRASSSTLGYASSTALTVSGNGYFGGNLGIGTTTPYSTLSIQGSGSTNPFTVASSTGTSLLTVLANGNVGIGSSTPVGKLSVLGNIALTQPTTNALIIGDVSGNPRGTNAIDIQSIRSAVTQVASGTNATAIGQNNTVTCGTGPCAGVGYGNVVNAGYNASAFGLSNTASGNWSTALGYNNSIASAYDHATAVGSNNSIGYIYSSAFGNHNSVPGSYSTAIGYSNTAGNSGVVDVYLGVFGSSNSVLSSHSYALGYGNSIGDGLSGVFAIGNSITNNTTGSMMIGPSDSAKVTILSSGNVGIGTSTPSSKLTIAGGDAWIGGNLTATGTATFGFASTTALTVSGNAYLLSGLSARASSTIGDGTGAGGLTISGNGTTTGNMYVAGMLGVGTIPSYPLHIVGQCVTADTRLRRRRRRTQDELDSDLDLALTEGLIVGYDHEYVYDEVMIKDVQAGDEVASMSQKTGELVWSEVVEKMPMGIQTIYQLTTQSGRQIRTTDNHPYFVRTVYEEGVQQSTTQKIYRFEVDQSIRIEQYTEDTIVAIGNEEHSFAVTFPKGIKQDLRDTFRVHAPKQFAPIVFASAIVTAVKQCGLRVHELMIDIEYPEYEDVISSVIHSAFPDIHVDFMLIGKKSYAHHACYGVHTKERVSEYHATMTDILENAESALRTVTRKHIRQAIRSPQALLVTSSVEEEEGGVKRGINMNAGLWIKTKDITVGQMIAVVHGGVIAWERITKIEVQAPEMVWDVEIAGTRNFIGNDIVAHNTFLGGGLRATASSTIGDGTGAGGLTIYGNATTTGNAYFGGNVGIGSTTPESSTLTIDKSAITGATIAGMKEYFAFANATENVTYYGNNMTIINAPTATSTLIGSITRIYDNSGLGNTVRGLEVQAHRGTTTKGENTGIAAFGRTLGIKGTTEGDAGSVIIPAGVFAESRGSTQGNALRAYSGTITSSNLISFFHDTSAFTGTGLNMNFGNSGGTFASTSSKFLDFQIGGTSKFMVTAQGTTTIGDGTTNNMAGLQIGYGGLCVDNDGSCTASTTGRITSVSSALSNSDLAEMYFSSEPLETGDIVSLAGGLSIGRADRNDEELSTVVGVISTKPGLLMGYDDVSLTHGETAYPVALKGRVPVKLSTENGPIEKGDSITLSSIPGVGMKATEHSTVVGIAMEDWDGSLAYSPAYLNQFGDDLVKAKLQPLSQNTDSRTQDGCSYGGGTESGTAPCVKEKVGTIKPQTTNVDTKTDVLDALKRETASTTRTDEGQDVTIGQAIMFVQLTEFFTESERTVLAELISTSTVENGNGTETLWDRIKTLAQNFVDGILTVVGLKAERIDVGRELCVDDVCVTADDLRALLRSVQGGNSEPEVGGGDVYVPEPEPEPEPEVVSDDSTPDVDEESATTEVTGGVMSGENVGEPSSEQTSEGSVGEETETSPEPTAPSQDESITDIPHEEHDPEQTQSQAGSSPETSIE